MKNILVKLKTLIEDLTEYLELEHVNELVLHDLGTLEKGFYTTTIAHDKDALDTLSRMASGVYKKSEMNKLPLYNKIEKWGHEHLESVERSRLLLIATTARNLLPAMLLEIIEKSNSMNIQTIYVVIDLGRIRDPIQFSQKAVAELAKVHRPELFKCHFVSDSRYSGVSIDQIAVYLSKEDESSREELIDRRVNILAKNRIETVLEAITAQERLLYDYGNKLLEGKKLYRAGVNKIEVHFRLAKDGIASEIQNSINFLREFNFHDLLNSLDLDEISIPNSNSSVDGEEMQSESQSEAFGRIINTLLIEGLEIVKEELKPIRETFPEKLAELKECFFNFISEEFSEQKKDLSRLMGRESLDVADTAELSSIDDLFIQVNNQYCQALKVLDNAPKIDLQGKAVMELWLKIRGKIALDSKDQGDEDGESRANDGNDQTKKQNNHTDVSADQADRGNLLNELDLNDLINRYGDKYFLEKTIIKLLIDCVDSTIDELSFFVASLGTSFIEEEVYAVFNPVRQEYDMQLDSNTEKITRLKGAMERISALSSS